MSKLMTREEACEYLGISMDTLERMIAKGDIQAYKVGRQVRIMEDAIQDYLQKHTMGNSTEA